MANPTFNIQDLVAPVGRSPAYPFAFPSAAQQQQVMSIAPRQVVPAPTGPPTTVSDRSDLNEALGQSPETGFLQQGAPSPTPTPTSTPRPALWYTGR